jgi:hypothetical protein
MIEIQLIFQISDFYKIEFLIFLNKGIKLEEYFYFYHFRKNFLISIINLYLIFIKFINLF